jgi:hypothetical protein
MSQILPPRSPDHPRKRREASQLHDQGATVAVPELVGDHPRLDVKHIQHVASAEVAELVELEPVVGIDGEAPAEMVALWQLSHASGMI